MGLEAVVYRNRAHLKLGLNEKFAQLVPETGEVYFESGELSRKYRDQLTASRHRFGNIAEISALREVVRRIIGAKSVIIDKVLYSGTHAGDQIPVESVSLIAAELGLMSNVNERSPELQRFVSSLEDLINCSRNEGNPIVFL